MFILMWWLWHALTFFFSSRRRHTRSYGDWSSDVCSSDLEAEQFLARLPTLSPAAWADIIARYREPLFPTLERLLRGLKLMITPRRFRRGFDAVYSKVAEDRLRDRKSVV